MSELGAWLADHGLEEHLDVLHEGGIELIHDLANLDDGDLAGLGLPAHHIPVMRAALQEANLGAAAVRVAAPQQGLPMPPPPPPNAAALPAPPAFTWRRSSGEILAQAASGALPPPPPPPMLARASSSTTEDYPAMLPPPPPPPPGVAGLPPPPAPPSLPPAIPAPPAAGQQAAKPAAGGGGPRPSVWRRSIAGVWEEQGVPSGAAMPPPPPPPPSAPQLGSPPAAPQRPVSAPTATAAPPPAAPPPPAGDGASGWAAYEDDDGAEYYHNDLTGETSWVKPRELGGDDSESHGGWVALLTDEGERYYHHDATGETSWETPAEWEAEADAAKKSSVPAGGSEAGGRRRSTAATVATAAATAHAQVRTQRLSLAQPPPVPVLPVPPALMPPPVPQDVHGDHVELRKSMLVKNSAPPPPEQPPPPFVWRRSVGEYLANSQQAANLGLPSPPPPIPPSATAVQTGGGAVAGEPGQMSVTVRRNEFGLGLSFGEHNELVYIDPRGGASSGGPCELQLGDVVVAIDGHATEGRPLSEVAASIGPAGATSTLLVMRSSGKEPQQPKEQKEQLLAAVATTTASTRRVKGKKKGEAFEELTLMVDRPNGTGALGISLNDGNMVLELAEGCDASHVMQVGDRILAVDGKELKGKRLAKVIRPQQTHLFKVLRRMGGTRAERLPLEPSAKEGLREARTHHWHWKGSGKKKSPFNIASGTQAGWGLG